MSPFLYLFAALTSPLLVLAFGLAMLSGGVW